MDLFFAGKSVHCMCIYSCTEKRTVFAIFASPADLQCADQKTWNWSSWTQTQISLEVAPISGLQERPPQTSFPEFIFYKKKNKKKQETMGTEI